MHPGSVVIREYSLMGSMELKNYFDTPLFTHTTNPTTYTLFAHNINEDVFKGLR
jgi:hypothetical protein